MEVHRIDDGLWYWTTFYEEWQADVGCVCLEADDAVCLIDPLIPADERDRFFAALDRDVARAGSPVHIFVSVFWHARSAGELAERYDADVWAASRARAAVARRAGDVRTFRPGDRLPGGIEALATARAGEVVFYLPAHRTLVPGDVILGAAGGGLRLCPDGWLPTGKTQSELRESLQPLLELRVDRVLVSHGQPVLEHGGKALAAILRG